MQVDALLSQFIVICTVKRREDLSKERTSAIPLTRQIVKKIQCKANSLSHIQGHECLRNIALEDLSGAMRVTIHIEFSGGCDVATSRNTTTHHDDFPDGCADIRITF